MTADYTEFERLISEKKTAKIIEYCQDVKLVPVCVPSFNARENAELLHNLDKIPSVVYLFIYEDQVEKYKFAQYFNNTILVKISKANFDTFGLRWRGIQPKRAYIQQYMAGMEISKYFVIDDDLKIVAQYVDEMRENSAFWKKKYCSLSDMLKVMQTLAESRKITVLSGRSSDIGFSSTKFKGFVNACPAACVYYDFSTWPDFVLYSDKRIHEDTDFYIKCMKASKTVGRIDFMNIQLSTVDSIASADEQMEIDSYLDCPEFMQLKVNAKNMLLSMPASRRLKKLTPEIDFELLEFVKSHSIDEIKEFIKTRKSSKVINTLFDE